jgi:hypothetical protein
VYKRQHSIQLNLDADIEEFIEWSDERIAELKRENKEGVK